MDDIRVFNLLNQDHDWFGNYWSTLSSLIRNNRKLFGLFSLTETQDSEYHVDLGSGRIEISLQPLSQEESSDVQPTSSDKASHSVSKPPVSLFWILDDDQITSTDTQLVKKYTEQLERDWQHLISGYPSDASFDQLHIVFLGSLPPNERAKVLQKIKIASDSNLPYSLLHQEGLSSLNRELLQTIRNIFNDENISFSFCYRDWDYSNTFDYLLFPALGFTAIGLNRASLFPYSKLRDSILEDGYSVYAADLQCILLGPEKRDQLYQTFCRTLLERWPVRYPHYTITRLGWNDVRKEYSFLLEVSSTSKVAKLHVSNVQSIDKTLSAFDIGSHLIDAKQNTFIWMIPSEWLEPAQDENIVNSPLQEQLIILGYICDALLDSSPGSSLSLYFFEVVQRHSKYSIQPWPFFTPENDPVTQESIRRRVPTLFEFIRSRFQDVRFHTLPWSSAGSHLDYAPVWIDHLLHDGLGWKLSSSGEYV